MARSKASTNKGGRGAKQQQAKKSNQADKPKPDTVADTTPKDGVVVTGETVGEGGEKLLEGVLGEQTAGEDLVDAQGNTVKAEPGDAVVVNEADAITPWDVVDMLRGIRENLDAVVDSMPEDSKAFLEALRAELRLTLDALGEDPSSSTKEPPLSSEDKYGKGDMIIPEHGEDVLVCIQENGTDRLRKRPAKVLEDLEGDRLRVEVDLGSDKKIEVNVTYSPTPKAWTWCPKGSN